MPPFRLAALDLPLRTTTSPCQRVAQPDRAAGPQPSSGQAPPRVRTPARGSRARTPRRRCRPRASGPRTVQPPSSPIAQNCATWRPSGLAIAARAAAGRASSKLSASASARATPYWAWSRAASRSRWPRKLAMITASRPPTATTRRSPTRCSVLPKASEANPGRAPGPPRVTATPAVWRPRRRSRRSAARPRAAARASRGADGDVDERPPGPWRHERRYERAATAGQVPRSQVRAQLGSEYCARNPGVEVPQVSRAYAHPIRRR